MENNYKNNKILETENEIGFETKIKIEAIAKQILRDMGIKIHHLGFKYWITAIYITLDIELSNKPNLRMMELYYMISKKHRTTVSRVERAMRYAYETTTIDLKQYFNVTYTINNTALLFLLVEAVKDKLYIQSNTEINLPKIMDCEKKSKNPINTPV